MKILILEIAFTLGAISGAFAQDAITPLQQAMAANNQAAAALSTALNAAQALQTANATLQSQLAAANTSGSTTQPATPLAGTQGVVNYFTMLQKNWDTFTVAPTLAQEAQIRSSINTAVSYTPYFDTRLSWLPNTEVYYSALAIYPGDSVLTTNPEYVAKDTFGRWLYINFACGGGTCTQWMLDITNPNARAWMTAKIQAAVAPGYTGLFLDEVDMHIPSTDGSGNVVAPKDPATGGAMTLTAWKTYMVALLKQFRAAIPSKHITHNSVWFDGSPASDPLVLAQMQQADRINLERGFGDTGIIGGTSAFSVGALMKFLNDVHATAKKPVNVMDYEIANQRYSLAGYFLIQEAGDSVGFADETLANWDPNHLYGVNLGAAKNYHYWDTQGCWHRDFANGEVLFNEPSQPVKTITVPAGYHYVGGGATPATITLGAFDGVILVNN